MKISLALSFIILIAAAWLGARDHRRLAELRTAIPRLELEAKSSLPSSEPANSARRERPDPKETTRLLTADLLAYLREIESTPEDQRGSLYPRFNDLTKRASLLDAASFKTLVTALRDATDLPASIREDVINWCMASFGEQNPHALLALITSGFDFPGSPRFQSSAISGALRSLAQKDLQSAVAWLGANGNHPAVPNTAKEAIISAAAESNPRDAFRLLADLKIQNPHELIDGILYSNQSAEKRIPALNALRDYLATADITSHDRIARSAVGTFAAAAARDGFDTGSKWISENFTESELAILSTTRFLSGNQIAEPAKWLTWLATAIPQGLDFGNFQQVMSNWTYKNPEAAGEWLVSAPEGPAKTAAVKAYAETVAPYEPETAAQWALTLPPGKDRDATLKTIHQKWPESDTAGASAFAEKHGIK